MNKNYIQLVAVALLIALFSCQKAPQKVQPVYDSVDEMVEASKSDVDSISPNEFKGLIDSQEYFYLIDVRSESEYSAGYIPSAVSIPRGVLEFRIADEVVWDKEGLYPPSKEDLIIVYCKKGGRSVLAAKALQQLGFTKVKYIIDGWTKFHELFPENQEKLIAEPSSPSGITSSGASGGGC